jgi:hypothetical protein
MKRETNNESVAKRIMGKIKNAARKVGNALDDLGNPRKNIDNPSGEYYADKKEYWDARAASEDADRINAAQIKDRLDRDNR